METKLYVDVLLVTNYIVNMLLLQCIAKLTGRRSKRRRIVAAALFGALSALTIFLPFPGLIPNMLIKLLTAVGIVLIAFSYLGFRHFTKQVFVFFAVSFFFGGVMLGIWMAFAPSGMLYHNGIVYFDISSITLILTTAVAYGALSLANRFARGGRVRSVVYDTVIEYAGRTLALRGLVDTGNSLYEPFSDLPVMVCALGDIAPLLPAGVEAAIRRGEHLGAGFSHYNFPVRLVPYSQVGRGGMIPAFRPDRLTLTGEGGTFRVDSAYIAISTQKISGPGYNALLNPDFIAIKL